MNQLHLLPCLDCDEMADSRREELNISRHIAMDLGTSAVDISRKGVFTNSIGQSVSFGIAVQNACVNKRSIPPDEPLPIRNCPGFPETIVQVTNETTLQASRRLVADGLRPLALNFANGISPGGGFLTGSRAQEEVLCRSSALYLTLVGDGMYDAHHKRPLPDSSDWSILSPEVPVFRRDDGTALEEPWLLDFITSAAPYAPTVGKQESTEMLKSRIHRVLSIAASFGYETLVLGAWGCGAFGNDPHRTAADFRDALKNDFRGAFAHIVFAITDWSPGRKFLGPFRDEFSE